MHVKEIKVGKTRWDKGENETETLRVCPVVEFLKTTFKGIVSRKFDMLLLVLLEEVLIIEPLIFENST
jgi:hypothetical protein